MKSKREPRNLLLHSADPVVVPMHNRFEYAHQRTLDRSNCRPAEGWSVAACLVHAIRFSGVAAPGELLDVGPGRNGESKGRYARSGIQHPDFPGERHE